MLLRRWLVSVLKRSLETPHGNENLADEAIQEGLDCSSRSTNHDGVPKV